MPKGHLSPIKSPTAYASYRKFHDINIVIKITQTAHITNKIFRKQTLCSAIITDVSFFIAPFDVIIKLLII